MFLPINKKDMQKRNWANADFVLVTGDAYVDHPSFGASIISRVLENSGYKVCILAQPNYRDCEDFKKFGPPRLGFLITSGVVESMVNNYTVNKKPRKLDVYSPDIKFKRPDRATIVYANLARQAYKNIPIILGGIEASLRRLAHYDYWQDKIRRSILLDSKADLLVYGMGENSILEIAESLNTGLSISDITFVNGTVYKTKDVSYFEHIELPTFTELTTDKLNYAKSFKIQNENTEYLNSKILTEKYGDWYVVQNLPTPLLTCKELDAIYELPYEKNSHPSYKEIGEIKAALEIKNSITANRGCIGGCNFCALTYHQGRVVQARTEQSIISEAILLTKTPDFKGYISDVGGPTANFMDNMCSKQLKLGSCKDKSCISPLCKNLKITHQKYLSILRKLRNLPKIKKVFIRSGIRYDYLMLDKDKSFFKELVEHHVSGQLRVAPEHISKKVLSCMGKPNIEIYDQFVKDFKTLNKKLGKKQYIVPYLMSSHPSCDLNSSIELMQYLNKNNQYPEQVQDFYPTPSTLSTVMYYTKVNPLTMEKIYVPTGREKMMQRALMQYKNPKNYSLIKEALIKTDRLDLIGATKNYSRK